MKHRNESHQINKFGYVLHGNLNQYVRSKLGGRPTVVGRDPPLIFLTVPNLGVVKKMKIAQEGIQS